ncbi:MAG TPA: 3-dehydro-L-gulonate 2-dehydrogenase [Mucilaginibacter sp.]|nr:3-dehydro-L-gulonate 2-dehydrogenase [Mucilaginibacter sp.]
MRIPFDQMHAEFKRVLLSVDFTDEKASKCAHIFATNSRDGVYTHGLNRFPLFVQYVKEGLVNPAAEPVQESAFGALEQWNGNLGPGVLNAQVCMDRAIKIAAKNGIGCVALKNTNHWMRGGTYGWQAADAGMMAMCFTNTIANLPPWGGIDRRLGNNPLVLAVPRKNGHVVLDMAISQYSVGKLRQYSSLNQELPLPGGYDENGMLTTNSANILDSGRLLPVGFWKGSGLALILDMLASVLSGGNSTAKITENEKESSVCQIFICIKPQNGAHTQQMLDEIINFTKASQPVAEGNTILYPGENALKTREKSLNEGVWVDEAIWKKVLSL